MMLIMKTVVLWLGTALLSSAVALGQGQFVFNNRVLPDINARNMQVRQAAERTAINAPMQGSAADIIKCAMIAVDRWILDEGVEARMIMQVHDELVLEVKQDAVSTVANELKSLMTNAATLNTPLLVSVGTGHNWDEAH